MFFTHTFTLLFSNLIAVGSGPPISVDNQLACARLCVDRDDCFSFFYNADTQACITSSVTNLTNTGLTEAQGYMYFIMQQGSISTADESVTSSAPLTSTDGQFVVTQSATDRVCGGGWTVQNGRCYLYVADRKIAPDAQAACEALGGCLAKIDSAIVNDFSKALFAEHGHFWLGGVDAAKDGRWSWRDGSPVSPVYWAPSQPDTQGHEDCMEQWADGWNDEPCVETDQPFLCEK